MRNIGIQLYTVRETIQEQGLVPVLKEISAFGYAGVEGGSFMGNMPAKDLRKVLDDLGLDYVSGHVSLDEIKTSYQQILEDYATLGAKYVGLSWAGEEHRKDAATWTRLAHTLERAGLEASKFDMTFFYHHHDFEFKKYDGKYGLDILLDAADPALLKLECDVYWTTKGGEDAAAYIAKRADRIALIHTKDMTSDGKDFFEIVGEGKLDFDAIYKAGDAAGVEWFLVEQDQCPQGELASAKKSRENIKARGWG